VFCPFRRCGCGADTYVWKYHNGSLSVHDRSVCFRLNCFHAVSMYVDVHSDWEVERYVQMDMMEK